MTSIDKPSPSKRVEFDLKNNDVVEDEPNEKRGRLCVVSASVFVSKLAEDKILRQMPLDIDNGLPGILLRLGIDASSDTCFLCHVDSCAAMNTGNLLLHQFIITNHPSVVAEYIQYDDSDPFDPIQLQCAVNDLDKVTEEHGKLTAIVRYRTPYTDTNGQPMLVSFGLGADVAVRSIIGVPTLRSWQASIDFGANKLICPGIQRRFQLQYELARQGLPQGATFDTQNFQRPQAATVAAIRIPDQDISAMTDSSRHESTSSPQSPYTVLDDTSNGYLQRRVQTQTS